MTKSNLPAIRPFLPFDGVTFHTEYNCPLEDVSADLCNVASFLQHRTPSARLERFRDWWEHDGLHFPDGATDYHALFQTVGTPRSLIESMTGDHRVFVGVSPQDRDWYLRFFVDWNDDDSKLIGEYSITLVAEPLLAPFSTELLPKLNCSVTREAMLLYFQRIEA